MIIGLTGKRGVGKSTVSDILEDSGFVRIHTFDGGKAATFGYFVHLGMPIHMADEAVYGELRDAPSEYLPGNQTPRSFMEQFGKFMGTVLGPEWTLGAEMDRVARDFPDRDVVVESLVYEAAMFKARGGKIIRVTRPDYEGVFGMMTDAAQAEIKADAEIINDGTVDDLLWKVEQAIEAVR